MYALMVFKVFQKLFFTVLCSWGNFYGKPLAAGSHNWLPAPLECTLLKPDEAEHYATLAWSR